MSECVAGIRPFAREAAAWKVSWGCAWALAPGPFCQHARWSRVVLTDRALPRGHAPLPPLLPGSSCGRAVGSFPSSDPTLSPLSPSVLPHPSPLSAPHTRASPDPRPSAPATPQNPLPLPLTHTRLPATQSPGPQPSGPATPGIQPPPQALRHLIAPLRPSRAPSPADGERWQEVEVCGGAAAKRTAARLPREGWSATRESPARPRSPQNTEPEAEKPIRTPRRQERLCRSQ